MAHRAPGGCGERHTVPWVGVVSRSAFVSYTGVVSWFAVSRTDGVRGYAKTLIGMVSGYAMSLIGEVSGYAMQVPHR